MDDLDELQRFMVRALRSRTALTRPEHDAETIERFITGNARLSPAARLDIYRRQFWLRHTACLVDDFPGLGGILGQRDWERLVEEYLTAFPPTSFTLRDLGARLPEHVEASTWLPHQRLCVDMARLEHAYIELFDAPDASSLDGASLGQLPPEAWETARLELAPTLRLLETTYPVAELRRRLRSNPDEAVAIPEPRPTHLCLYRNSQHELRWLEQPRGAFELLKALSEGDPLIAACERAAECDPECDVPGRVGRWFEDWGRRGWFSDVRA
jgi:hypothetical protein